jgi:hypothetical protein
VPAGHSTIRLRYRPWDVPAGILLSVAGLGVAVYWFLRPGSRAS